jgi:hypothetical protein
MIIATDMPAVSQCAVTECAYNAGAACHAKAVTIGDGDNPGCDTYFTNSKHTHRARTAGVGACKVMGCKHNDDFECSADAINVGFNSSEINCLTYASR